MFCLPRGNLKGGKISNSLIRFYSDTTVIVFLDKLFNLPNPQTSPVPYSPRQESQVLEN